MPPSRGYSATVKQEVVHLIESGLSIAEAAQQANVSPSTARRWWKMYETDGPEALGIEIAATADDPASLESTDSQILRTSRNAERFEDEDETNEGEAEGVDLVVAGGDTTEVLEPTKEPFNVAIPLARQAPPALGRDGGMPAKHTASEPDSRQAWRNFKTNLGINFNNDGRTKAAIIGIILIVAGIIWIVDLTTDASTEDCWIGVIQAETVQAAIADGRILWDPFWVERFAGERDALNWIANKRDWFFSECRPYLEEEARPDELQRIWFVFGI